MRGGIRILHVDDEPEFTEITATFLENENDDFTIETETDAEEGLELLTEGDYDCVVSDYDMPGKNGIEFLKKVRESFPNLPFMLFTGKGSEEVASKAISAGVTDYLQKRASTEGYELLANRIENAVRAQRSAERAARQEDLMRLTEIAGNAGGFEIDLETGKLFLTGGAKRITGVPESEEFYLKETIESYHPEDRDRVREALERVIETREEEKGVFRSQTGEGERLLELTMKPVIEDGEVTNIRGAVNDITDQRERQHELEQIESLFENAQDTLFLINVGEGFVIERVNPAFEDATGLSPEQVRGREVRDIFGEGGAKMEERYTRCVEKEEPLEYEEQVRLDGELKYWETSIAPVVLDGSVEYIAGATREVTERGRREKEQRRVKQRLNLAVEGAGLGVWDWDMESGEIRHNEKWAEMLGLPSEDGVVSVESVRDRFHPEDLPESKEETEEVLAGEMDRYENEVRRKTADGDWKWIRTVGKVVERDEDGNAMRAVGVNIDIDERKKQKKELERYKTFVESSSDVIAHIEADGTTLYQSPAVEELYGYDHEEIVGDDVFEYVHPDDREKVAEKFYAILEDPEKDSGKVEYRVRDADGDYVWTEAVGKDQRDTEAGGVVINERDITERKRKEKRLEEFASVVSHDLRNPLSVAKGRVELAKEDCGSEHLDSVDDALDRMDVLIEDILALAQEGSDLGEMEVIETEELSEDCWSNVKTEDATLVTELEGAIKADPGRLKQVLENLLRNAVEHGGENVTVTVGELDDRNGFYVADDGNGIPEEERDKVFETGYSTSEAGTGFGLSIVEEIAEAHGWGIEVKESEDGGARFEVCGVDVPETV